MYKDITSNTTPYIISTNRGGKKLVDENNHTYKTDKRANKVWYWKCVVTNCVARAKTIHGQDEGGKEIISEFAMINAHTHASNSKIVSSLWTKQMVKSLKDATQEITRTVAAKTAQDLSLR